MKRIKFSLDGMCASEREAFNPGSQAKTKKEWIDAHDLFISDTGDVFALVDSISRVFFMDAITGSLYEFGNCLTSDVLKIKGLRRNRDKASKKLMEMKVVNEVEA